MLCSQTLQLSFFELLTKTMPCKSISVHFSGKLVPQLLEAAWHSLVIVLSLVLPIFRQILYANRGPNRKALSVAITASEICLR